jgi:hypothetical protein
MAQRIGPGESVSCKLGMALLNFGPGSIWSLSPKCKCSDWCASHRAEVLDLILKIHLWGESRSSQVKVQVWAWHCLCSCEACSPATPCIIRIFKYLSWKVLELWLNSIKYFLVKLYSISDDKKFVNIEMALVLHQNTNWSRWKKEPVQLC